MASPELAINTALQSAFFNPGILMAVTVRGGVPAGDFFALLAAEVVGYFAGGFLVSASFSLFKKAGPRLVLAASIDFSGWLPRWLATLRVGARLGFL